VTPNQYRHALKLLGLSVSKGGPFLGFTRRHSFRVAAGEAEVPEAARKLLLLMIQEAIRPQDEDCWDTKAVLRAAVQGKAAKA